MAIAPPPPTGLLYVAGAALLLLGFRWVLRWTHILRGKIAGPTRTTIAAAILTFLLGSVAIAVALGIDISRWNMENTRSVMYHAEVRVNGTYPVRLLLPAPSNSQFWGFLNATTGGSTLRLSHTPDDTSVVVTAVADVSFEVRGSVLSPELDRTLTRANPQDEPWAYRNVTIELMADGSGNTTVDLRLRIGLSGFCYGFEMSLDATLYEGTANYAAEFPLAVC